LFFSFSHGKLGTYILPCFPPLVILIAIGLLDYLEGGKKRAFILGFRVLAIFTGILAVALVVSQVADFIGLRAYGPSETWKWVVGAAGLMAWSGLLAYSVRLLNFKKQILLYAAAPFLFMFSAHFIMPDLSRDIKAPGEFLLSHANRVRPDSVLVANDMERAVCWFYRRDDVYLLGNGGELSYGLSYDDSGHRRLAVGQLKKLIEDSHAEKEVVLITDTEDYSRYRPLLPKPIFEDIDGRFVFAQF
jgi:4-amino-4-deoxy-L-arabinose transferase